MRSRERGERREEGVEGEGWKRGIRRGGVMGAGKGGEVG